MTGSPAAAIVLFAHGARDAGWAGPFSAVAARVRVLAPGLRVELAFLELMSPDLGGVVHQLAADGIGRVDVVPLFLGTGGHMRRDLPRRVDAVRAAHPGLAIRLHPAIGEAESVIDALAAAAITLAGSVNNPPLP